MKALLFLAVVLLGVWLWRSGRRVDSAPDDKTDPAPSATAPQEMTRCAHCGVHLPLSDAVKGRQGLYCSAEHRQVAES